MDQASSEIPIVYASFDRFPSPKGAATHINAFVTALGQHFGNVDLLTIPSEDAERADTCGVDAHAAATGRTADRATDDSAAVWNTPGVTHHPIRARGGNLFERVLSFRSQSWRWWQQRFGEQNSALPIVHFRSIYEGYPIARQKDRFCRKLVFEVNGLPSIELKYHYPRVADDAELQKKLLWQEQICLEAADLILTVSRVNAEHLMQRGVPADRICIIPNGVDLQTFCYGSPRDWLQNELSREPSNASGNARSGDRPMRMLYSGTMSAWQGVGSAIEALRLYRRDFPATLTLVGHSRPHQRRDLANYAHELGVYDAVQLLEPVSKQELATLHHQADVVVAPLTRNDRNLVQGCCPLKVLEAMASGTPLIASDLPVVRELVTNNTEGLLVRPGCAKAIKDAMLRLRSEEGLAERISLAARTRVELEFSWERAQATLVQAYEDLLGEPVG